MTTFARLGVLALMMCLASLSPAPAPAVARALTLHDGVQGLQPSAPASPPVASATLTQCVTTGTESERSLTVAGQMTLVTGSSRMQMRTYLVQRRAGETQFHMIVAPGLGAWLEAEPGVKTYKDLRQVTNLSVPAVYRAVVDFRWLSPHGHIVKRLQLNTSRCTQPAPSAASTPTAPSTAPATSPS